LHNIYTRDTSECNMALSLIAFLNQNQENHLSFRMTKVRVIFLILLQICHQSGRQKRSSTDRDQSFSRSHFEVSRVYQREKIKIANSFNRAAQSYDQAAELQYGIGDKLLKLLKDVVINPKVIVDLGGGTGYLAKRLLKRYPDARVILADLADDMLSVAQQQLVSLPIELINADFDQLPLAKQTLSLMGKLKQAHRPGLTLIVLMNLPHYHLIYQYHAHRLP